VSYLFKVADIPTCIWCPHQE